MMHSLIVGGTRGIGREVVRLFSGKGEAVSVIGGRPPAAGEEKLPRVRHWKVDITDPAALETVFPEILARGKLSSLVFAQRYKGSGNAWDGEIATSLTAARTIIDRLALEFAAAGAIVLTSSVVSHLVADEQQVGYHVAKAGLNQMARYYAVKLGGRGIRVNTVSPSVFVKEESREYYAQNGGLCDLFGRITPLGRMGEAREVAAAIAFLCSPDASFITGQDLVVDGGISLQAQPTLARKL